MVALIQHFFDTASSSPIILFTPMSAPRLCTKLISQEVDTFAFLQPSKQLIYLPALTQDFLPAVAWRGANIKKLMHSQV